jgi:hypothetical protein
VICGAASMLTTDRTPRCSATSVIAAATAASKDSTSIGALLNQVHGAPTRYVDVDFELGIHRLDVDAEDFLDDPGGQVGALLPELAD